MRTMDQNKKDKLSMSKRILIAEDDENFGDTLSLEYEDRGFQTDWVRSVAEFKALETCTYDWAVIDLKLGQDSGLELLDLLKKSSPRVEALILTGYGSFATAVKAMKVGACNYLPKPATFRQIEACFNNKHYDEPFQIYNHEQTPSLARHEREYIGYILSECDGNISQAAKKLGIYRQSLQRKLKKFTPLK